MKFLVRMNVKLPIDMPEHIIHDLQERERKYSHELQRTGAWEHIWRVAGEYANYSIFEVDSNDELHNMLTSLPLFPYMQITVTPLAQHPSKLFQ